MSLATRDRIAATSTLAWTSDSALQSHVLGCDGVHLVGECPQLSEFDRSAFQNENGDTVCRGCRGDYYGCDCPPPRPRCGDHNRIIPCPDCAPQPVQYLSMPDPEGTTRLDIIRERLAR